MNFRVQSKQNNSDRMNSLHRVASKTGGFQHSEAKIRATTTLKKLKQFSKVNEVQKEIALISSKNQELIDERDELCFQIKELENEIETIRKDASQNTKGEIEKYNQWINRDAALQHSSMAYASESNIDGSMTGKKKMFTNNLKTLENRIEKRLNDLSSAGSKNEQLRLEIDQMRREIKLVKQIKLKLNEDLVTVDSRIEKKRENLMFLNKKYAQWTEINSEIDKNTLEKKELYNRGFQTLQVGLMRQNNVSKVRDLKEDRQSSWKAQELKKLNQSKIKNQLGNSDLSDEEDQDNGHHHSISRQAKKKGEHGGSDWKVKNKSLQQHLSKMDGAIANMQELTGLENWKDIIAEYKKKYEINEKKNEEAKTQLDELEELKRTREQIKNEIEQLRAQYKKEWRKRDATVQDYQNLIKEVDQKRKFYARSKKELVEVIGSIKIGIPIILERIGATEESGNEQSFKPEEEKVVDNLFSIEKRTNEILALFENYQQGMEEPQFEMSTHYDEAKKEVIAESLYSK